jgi:3-vinyl bacteriochlorophyllide hydratase
VTEVERQLGTDGQDRGSTAVSTPEASAPVMPKQRRPLYTAEERERRDSSPWTLIQGLLAPIQFIIFGISLYLVLDYLRTGDNKDWALWSVVIKTMALYTIMITGAIWEKVVFGKYLFAESFFWEDVFSMLVIALHTAYLIALFWNLLDTTELMWLALAAYFTYVINAGQFIWKLRMARLEGAGKRALASNNEALPA